MMPELRLKEWRSDEGRDSEERDRLSKVGSGSLGMDEFSSSWRMGIVWRVWTLRMEARRAPLGSMLYGMFAGFGGGVGVDEGDILL